MEAPSACWRLGLRRTQASDSSSKNSKHPFVRLQHSKSQPRRDVAK